MAVSVCKKSPERGIDEFKRKTPVDLPLPWHVCLRRPLEGDAESTKCQTTNSLERNKCDNEAKGVEACTLQRLKRNVASLLPLCLAV